MTIPAEALAGCIYCHKPYSKQAKPIGVFHPDGTFAGTVHTSCADKIYYSKEFHCCGSVTHGELEFGRAMVWLRYLHHAPGEKLAEGSPYWYARGLFRLGQGETLTGHQQDMLDTFWHLTNDQRDAVILVYQEILDEYTVWRKSISDTAILPWDADHDD